MVTPEWPCSVGEGAGASDFQGMEALWPLGLAQKWTPKDTKTQKIQGSGAAHIEGGGTQGRRRDPRRANPQGTARTWVQAEGGKGGGDRRGT